MPSTNFQVFKFVIIYQCIFVSLGCIYTTVLLRNSTLSVWAAYAAPMSLRNLFICQLPDLHFICSSLMNGESLLVHKFIENSGTSAPSPLLMLWRYNTQCHSSGGKATHTPYSFTAMWCYSFNFALALSLWQFGSAQPNSTWVGSLLLALCSQNTALRIRNICGWNACVAECYVCRFNSIISTRAVLYTCMCMYKRSIAVCYTVILYIYICTYIVCI